MPVRSWQYNYVYFCAPATGSTAVSRTLVEEGQGKWVPEDYKYGPAGNVILDRKHATLSQCLKEGVLTKEDIQRNYLFVNIRNPFDRVVSEYNKMRKLATVGKKNFYFDPRSRHAKIALLPFAEYVRVRFSNAKPIDVRYLYVGEMNRFLRMEKLEDDFKEAADQIGLPADIRLRRTNVWRDVPPDDYRRYYDDHSKSLVERAHEQVLSHFGYEF